MSHHEPVDSVQDHAETDANATVDMFAMLGIVLVIVALAVYYVSR